MFIELTENKKNAQYTIISTWIIIGMSVPSILWDIYAYFFIHSTSYASGYDYTGVASNILKSLIVVTSYILFLFWVHTLYINVGKAGGYQRYKEYWAILAWFVPFVNLLVPYQIMLESYQSMQNIREGDRYGRSLPILKWWWILLIANILGSSVMSFLVIAHWPNPLFFQMVVTSLSLIGYWLTIKVIQEISAEESRLYEYVTKMMESTQDLNPDSPNEEGQGSIWA